MVAVNGSEGYYFGQTSCSNVANYSYEWVNIGGGFAAMPKSTGREFGDEFGPLAREGDIESPLQWLDRRVNEMRVRL